MKALTLSVFLVLSAILLDSCSDSSSNAGTDPSAASQGGTGGLWAFEGTLEGAGFASIRLMEKGGDTLAGVLVMDYVPGEQGLPVFAIRGRIKDDSLTVEPADTGLLGWRLLGRLRNGAYKGIRADAKGEKQNTFELGARRLPYALTARLHEKRTEDGPLQLDVHVSWTEMIEPTDPQTRDAFNRHMHSYAEEGWNNFEKDFAQEAQSLKGQEMPGYANTRSLHQYDELMYADEELVGLRQMASFYMGGAHPMWGLGTLTFDVKGRRFLKPADFFADGRKPLRFLSDYCRKTLRERFKDQSFEDMILQGTEPKDENFEQLLPMRQGLLVQFNPYEVGPYVIGAPEVLIPWQDVMIETKLSPVIDLLARRNAQP